MKCAKCKHRTDSRHHQYYCLGRRGTQIKRRHAASPSERAQAVMGMLYEIFCGDAKAVGARVAAPAPRPSTPARGDTAQFARITAVARR